MEELAVPKVFQVPDVKRQDKIITDLEQLLDDQAAHRTAGMKEISEWYDPLFAPDAPKLTSRQQIEIEGQKMEMMTALPDSVSDAPVFYLGTIVLTNLPKAKNLKKLTKKLLKNSRLEQTGHAIQGSPRLALPKAPG